MGYSNQIEFCTGALAHGDITTCPTDTGYETDANLVETATGTLIGKTLSDTATDYWIASRYNKIGNGYTDFYGRYIITSGSEFRKSLQGIDHLRNRSAYNLEHGVRPILTLKSTIKIESGEGTSGSPYILS